MLFQLEYIMLICCAHDAFSRRQM